MSVFCVKPEMLYTLCQELKFSAEVTDAISRLFQTPAVQALSEQAQALTLPGEAENASKNIAAALSQSGEYGLDILTIYLEAALIARQKWSDAGISDSVFLDTMGCFPRFVGEHQVSFGKWGFDRHFWAWRQTSGLLFRLGTLEYEMRLLTEDITAGGISLHTGEPILSIHIPSDADLSRMVLLESFRQATEFFRHFFPDYRYRAAYCGTWLLSDNLRSILPENSRIRQFQDCFDMAGCDDSRNACITWVFKREYDNPADYPEDTSLQRSIKQMILSGKCIGAGQGLIPQELLPGYGSIS